MSFYDGSILQFNGEVVPFVGVFGMLVKFFRSVGISDVASVSCSYSMITSTIGHDRGMVPLYLGIFEKRYNATPRAFGLRGQPAEFQQCRIDHSEI